MERGTVRVKCLAQEHNTMFPARAWGQTAQNRKEIQKSNNGLFTQTAYKFCGLRSIALLTTCPSGLLNVWPIQLQALCLISCSIGCCPVCLQSSLLLIFLGHQIRKMFLRLLLMNTCNFCSNPLVSQPPSFRTIQEYRLHIWPKGSQLSVGF